MKRRDLTPEERALWKASNRDTRVLKMETDGATSASGIHREAKSSSPRRGEVGRGAELRQHCAQNQPPPLPSPSGGGLLALTRSTPIQPLQLLSTREAARRFKTHPIDATLDLHGYTRVEAEAKLQHFIARAQRLGHRHLVIITGKGRGGEVGVLRRSLPEWLNGPTLRPHISAIAHAKPEKGGVGLTHVLVKRP